MSIPSVTTFHSDDSNPIILRFLSHETNCSVSPLCAFLKSPVPCDEFHSIDGYLRIKERYLKNKIQVNLKFNQPLMGVHLRSYSNPHVNAIVVRPTLILVLL